MKPMSRNKARRGATLVELLVASAVGGMVLVSTLTVFNASRAAQTSAERMSTSYQSLSLAVLAMQRQLENAGYRFPGQSVWVRNNVTTSMTFANGPGVAAAIPVVSETDSAAGVIEGTDVIEFYIGDENRLIGTVTGLSIVNSLHSVSFDSSAPLTPAEVTGLQAGAKGPLVVFADATASCLGLVEGVAAPNASGQFLVRLYGFNGPKLTAGNECPTPGMRIFGLAERRRYMIYKEAGVTVPGIYGQTSVSIPGLFQNAGTLGAPFLLARGVEDMQFSPILSNSNNDLNCGPNKITCRCGERGSTCPTDKIEKVTLFRGVRFRLVSKGVDPLIRKGQGRPEAFDRDAGTVVDDIQRHVMEGFIDFPNLNPVVVNPI